MPFKKPCQRGYSVSEDCFVTSATYADRLMTQTHIHMAIACKVTVRAAQRKHKVLAVSPWPYGLVFIAFEITAADGLQVENKTVE